MDLKKKEFDDNFKTKIDSLNPIIQEMAGPAIDEAIQEAIQSSKDGIQAVGNEQVQRVKAAGNELSRSSYAGYTAAYYTYRERL